MCVHSVQVESAHQQLPRSPCRMSEGRGVRNTVHFTARSLKLQQLISCGRSHFLTRCWTLSSTGKPTDFGPGGKLSSTNVTVFWKEVNQNNIRLLNLEWSYRPCDKLWEKCKSSPGRKCAHISPFSKESENTSPVTNFGQLQVRHIRGHKQKTNTFLNSGD